jgi:23S rRNA pseudouridine1911/1915/1917 synthase
VPSTFHGERLCLVASRMMPAVSRSYLKKLIKDGRCTLNGAPAAPSDKVRGGDIFSAIFDLPPRLPCHAEPGALDLRHEDEHTLVVNKPPGVVCHPAKGHYTATLLNFVVAHLEDEIQRGWSRPHIITRLDKNTSGLVLVAKTPLAHRALQKSLDAREITRRYLALVWGHLEKSRGVLTSSLSLDHADGLHMVAGDAGKPAVTEYLRRRVFALSPMAVAAGCPPSVSLAHLRLHTGRTHQIRVQMADLGHPVLGDDLYGPPSWQHPRDGDLAAMLDALGGYALHAGALMFPDPAASRLMRVIAPPPAPLLSLLGHLGRGKPSAARSCAS